MGDASMEFRGLLRAMDGKPDNAISSKEWDIGCEVLRSQPAASQGALSVSEECAVVGSPDAVRELYAQANAGLKEMLEGSKGVCIACDFGRCDKPRRRGGFDFYRVEVPRSECAELPASTGQLAGAHRLETGFGRLLEGSGIAVGLKWKFDTEEDGVIVSLKTPAGAFSALAEMKGMVFCSTEAEALMVFRLVDETGRKIAVEVALPILLAIIEGNSARIGRYEKDCPAIDAMVEAMRENADGGFDITMKSGRVISFGAVDVVKAVDRMIHERRLPGIERKVTILDDRS